MTLTSSSRGSDPNVLKRAIFNPEREVSPHIKRENINLESEVSTFDGLRMTNNYGMLNAITGTLPWLARSWSLMLEELSPILWRDVSTPHRWFSVDYQLKAWWGAYLSMATTLNVVWKVMAEACLMWLWNLQMITTYPHQIQGEKIEKNQLRYLLIL